MANLEIVILADSLLWRGGVSNLQITLFFVLQVTPAHLLDTGILIRRLRNRTGYHDLVQRLNQTGDLYGSAFTRVEVLRGMREHERERTVALLDGFITQVIDRATADQAGEWIRDLQSRGITLGGPDAVIAASALHARAALVTTNARHFPIPELTVLSVDENGQLRTRHKITIALEALLGRESSPHLFRDGSLVHWIADCPTIRYGAEDG